MFHERSSNLSESDFTKQLLVQYDALSDGIGTELSLGKRWQLTAAFLWLELGAEHTAANRLSLREDSQHAQRLLLGLRPKSYFPGPVQQPETTTSTSLNSNNNNNNDDMAVDTLLTNDEELREDYTPEQKEQLKEMDRL